MNKDRLTKARRSWNMSRIRSKNTAPEKAVRSLLHRMGYRFRLHVRIPVTLSASVGERAGVRCRFRLHRKIPIPQPSTINRLSRRSRTKTDQPSRRRFITPDIVLVKQRVAIFVHGCFWHRHRGCKNCTTPTNRREWCGWAKLNGNAE